MLTFSNVEQTRKFIGVTSILFAPGSLTTLNNSTGQRRGLGKRVQSSLDFVTRMPGCVEYSVLINNQLVVTYSNGCKFTDGINVVKDLKKQHQGTCQPLRYFREIKNLRKKYV